MTPDPGLFLSIDRRFAAPVERVFRLWSDPALRRRWWGPAGFTCTALDSDFRPGGAWSATIASAQHGTHRMSGHYRQIVADERIVFSFLWADDPDQPPGGNEVQVTFRALPGGATLQSFRQGPFLAAAGRDSHAEGWGECLDRQQAELEGTAR